MPSYDLHLSGYRREIRDAYCPDPACGNYEGAPVTVETEFGQSWATPEECGCGRPWVWEKPVEEEGG